MRSKNIVWIVTFALATTIVAGCATLGGSRSIAELQHNPGRFADHTVNIEGVVTSSWGIPMVPFKVYRVSDGSGEMTVISDNNRIPSKNTRVRVRGEVQEFALIGGRSFGLHMKEKGLKYMY